MLTLSDLLTLYFRNMKVYQYAVLLRSCEIKEFMTMSVVPLHPVSTLGVNEHVHVIVFIRRMDHVELCIFRNVHYRTCFHGIDTTRNDNV